MPTVSVRNPGISAALCISEIHDACLLALSCHVSFPESQSLFLNIPDRNQARLERAMLNEAMATTAIGPIFRAVLCCRREPIICALTPMPENAAAEYLTRLVLLEDI